MDIWSILILIIAAHGVFTLTLLLFSGERKANKGNAYLFCIVFFVLWILIEFLSVRNVYRINLDIFYGTRYGSWLVLGPLIYFYYSSVTKKNWKFTYRSLWHFLPFVIFVIAIPFIAGDDLSERQIHYGMLAVFDHRPKTVTNFERLYSHIFYLQFIHFGTYLLYNFKLIRDYVKDLKRDYSNINNLFWLRSFNIVLIITLILASTFLYILFSTEVYHRTLDYIYILPMGIFIYSITYHLSRVKWLAVVENKQKYLKSTLNAEAKVGLIRSLESLMSSKKPYLQNDLRIKSLASQLEVSSHHLSQIINEHYQLSFFDYINRFRVAEAKSLIKGEPAKTLMSIAFESGFNNKTSFVNAFKKFEEMTPSLFRKRII